MKIIIITPAGPDSKAGNRATAVRWQQLLEDAGHHVEVATDYDGEFYDLMIALHAWRSAVIVHRFRECWPTHPLIVVLTGTDIYHYQHEYPEPTHASMASANVLIGLHDLVARDIPERFHSKLITLRQSAPVPSIRAGLKAEPGQFNVCVIGHLRAEKDSLRAAWASRLLPDDSHIIVSCAGKPHNDEWRDKALQESKDNPRFHWLGELEKPQLEQLMSVCNLMVISSVMEGGANVVSEACRAGLPILASDISGNRGLLGDDYPGYFPVGDDRALAELMYRVEQNPGLLATLVAKVDDLAKSFTAEKERQSLEKALALAMKAVSPEA
ncbi:selenoneine biosynthesis selenosugar synthase SenB [Marinobacter sp.]|uniref:selenoneine biosynthesis selenosugar synthase SenB n=1 Tax=Marinobacter sp. TaxID=50741 RepID=UPI0019E5720C|nr:selenoneine biosynthesis selenosugar synthase SenB [Marinobacter sp.]MBE0484888.1 TIGR04348 family glycosyltransferase [Marinobacter sp.]